MSGLILAGIGRGIANAGETYGNAVFRAAERREELEERLAARAEEKRLDRELKRELVDAAGGGRRGGDSGSGAGSGSTGRTSDLSNAEVEGMAAEMGMSVPEFLKFREAHRSGDVSGYKVETPTFTRQEDPGMAGEGGEYSDAVSRKASELKQTGTTQELPAGFDKFMQSRLEKFARLSKERSFGGTGMKGLAEAEEASFKTGLIQHAIKNPKDAPIIGQATAAASGKPLQGGNSDVTRNLFTGVSETTQVGKSVISENNAQAGAANARAKNEGRAPQSTPSATLNALQGSIRDLRKSIRDGDYDDDQPGLAKAKQRLIEMQDQAAAIAKNMGKGTGKDSAASGASKGAAADVFKPSSKDEFEKLPSGALYVNPADGLTYRKK